MLLPCLAGTILTLLKRLLALRKALHRSVEALKVVQILNLTAAPRGKPSRARDCPVDLADDEEPQEAQPLLDNRCRPRAIHGGDPGRHELQDEERRLLHAASSRHTKELYPVAQILVSADAPQLRAIIEANSIAEVM